MIRDYTLSFFGAETEVGPATLVRKPFMNIIGLKGDPKDSQKITNEFYGSGSGAIPKETDLFEVLYFSFGLGTGPGYKNEGKLHSTLNSVDSNRLFDSSATLPKDISDLAKKTTGNMQTNGFIVEKYIDSHSTNLAKALMTGKGFKAAQIYLLQAGNKDCKTGFVANRFVFLDLFLTNIEYTLGAVDGDSSDISNIPKGYAGKTATMMSGGVSGNHTDAERKACETLTFSAQHTWVYTYFYDHAGKITNICKGR